jgi:hypothetical protein
MFSRTVFQLLAQTFLCSEFKKRRTYFSADYDERGFKINRLGGKKLDINL